MPDEYKYQVTTPDGQLHNVKKSAIDKLGAKQFVDAFSGGTIRMRDAHNKDYDMPVERFEEASNKGYRPFTIKSVSPSPKSATIPVNVPNIKNVVSDSQDNGYVGTKMQNMGLPSHINPNDRRYHSPADVDRVVAERSIKAANKVSRDAENMMRSGTRDAEEQEDERPWWANFVPAASGGVNASQVMRDQRNEGNDGARTMQAGYTISNKMKDAKEALTEYKHSGNTTWAGRMARGAKHALTDIRTFDNGMTDMGDAKTVYDAATAFDNGTATPEQKTLLMAAALNTDVQDRYGDSLGGLYGAGKMLVANAPFMAQMAASPLSGLGRTAMEASEKYITKKLGKSLCEKALGKILTTTAKATGRVAGDAVEAAGLEATFGGPTTMANTYNRMTGTVLPSTDQNGNITYTGDRSEKENRFSTALGKSAVDNYFEYQSEMMGEYFKPIGDFMRGGVTKALGKIGLGKVGNWITGVSNNQFTKAFNDFTKKTRYDGTIGEYGEEVAKNIENAITVGDMNFNGPDDPNSVYNKKTNWDTFLGVALTGGFMSSFHTGAYAVGKYRAHRDLNKSDALAQSVFGTKWQDVKDKIDNADDKEISDVMNSITKDPSSTPHQRQAATNYAAMLYINRGANLKEMKGKLEGDYSQLDQSFDDGASLTPEQRHDAKIDYDESRKKLESYFGGNAERIISSFDRYPSETLHNVSSINDEASSAIISYINAKAKYDGMIQGIQDDIDVKKSKAKSEIQANTHTDNMIHPIVLQGSNTTSYMTDGELSYNDDGTIDVGNSDKTLIVRDSDGNMRMVTPMDIQSVEPPFNAESYAEQVDEDVTTEAAKQASDSVDGILPFNQGDTYDILTSDGNPLSVTISQVSQDGKNVQLTDGSIVPMQQIQDGYYMKKLNDYKTDREKESENRPSVITSPKESYDVGDVLTLIDPESNTPVTATISTPENDDHKMDVEMTTPNGEKLKVPQITVNEINSMFAPEETWETEYNNNGLSSEDTADTESSIPVDEVEGEEETVPTEQQQVETAPQLVRSEKGEPMYEQSPIESTIQDMHEQGADNEEILSFAQQAITEYDAQISKLSKSSPKRTTSFSDFHKKQAEIKSQIQDLSQRRGYWESVINEIKPNNPESINAIQRNKPSVATQPPVESVPSADKKERGKRTAQKDKKKLFGKFSAENQEMGDYIDLHDYLLRNIASGVKFVWKTNGVKRGLAAELGFGDSETERRKRIGILANADNGGMTVDELAHSVWQERQGPWQNADTEDIKNEILDILMNHNSHSSMIKEAMDNHKRGTVPVDEDYEVMQYKSDYAHSRHINVDDIDDYEDIVREDSEYIVENFGAEEINAIFAEYYININDNEGYGRGQTEETGSVQNVERTVHEGKEQTRSAENGSKEMQGAELDAGRENDTNVSGETERNRTVETDNNSTDNVPVRHVRESVPGEVTYEPVTKAAADKALQLDEEIEAHRKALSDAYKLIEKKRAEFSGRNSLFGDAVTTDIFNDSSDLSEENMRKQLQKYIDAADAEKRTLDKLISARDGTLKDIDDAEMSQGNIFDENPGDDNNSSISDRIELMDDNTEEDGKNGTVYKSTVRIDGKHDVVKVDEPNENGKYNGSSYQYDGKKFGDIPDVVDYIDRNGDATPKVSIEAANEKRMSDIESRLTDIDSRRMEISDMLNDETSDHSEDDALYAEDQSLVEEKKNLESEYKGLKHINAESSRIQQEQNKVSDAISSAESQVDDNPTDAQKEAGNYKKGHVRIDGYDITIENPKGSVRSGKGSDGKEWHTTMHNTYGYIKGTEGVDGDHIDIFLSDYPSKGDVYVIDQVNKDGTFDEHKVMYGFNSEAEAKTAYLSNHEKGWTGLGNITKVSKEEFKKWVESSHRKTKPFADYTSVKSPEEEIDRKPTTSDILGLKRRNEKSDEDKLFNEVLEDINKFVPIANVTYLNRLLSSYHDEVKSAENLVDDSPGDFTRSLHQKTLDDEKAKVAILSDIIEGVQYKTETKRKTSVSEENSRKTMPSNNLDKLNLKFDEIQKMSVGTKAEIDKKYNELFALKAALITEFGTSPKQGTALGLLNSINDEFHAIQGELEDLKPMPYIEERNGFKEGDKVVFGRGTWTVTKLYEDYMLITSDDGKDTHSVDYDEVTKGEYKPEPEYTERFGFKKGDKVFIPEIKRYGIITELKQRNAVVDCGQAPVLYVTGNYETMKKEIEEVHKLVTNERYAELKKRMLEKMKGQLNIGIDPEILAIGTEMAVYHIEGGARKFSAYVKAMVADLGDAIRPYLKSFYNGARDLPEMSEISKDMDDYDTVSKTDITKPDSDPIETADVISQEYNAQKDTEKVKEKVNNQVNTEISRNKNNDKKKKSVSSQNEAADLFGTENINESKNGLQRINGNGTEGLSTDSSEELRPAESGIRTEAREETGGADERGRRRDNGGERSLRFGLSLTENPHNNVNNNHSERGKDYAPRSVDLRIDANIKAIELMKSLIESGDKATREQMNILRQFSGWGGLGKAFTDKSISDRLRALLGDEAYEQANMSRNSAYYTPAKIVDSLWDIVSTLGFKGGNILEGSAGIGNIIGAMPKDISERSSIQAVEIDNTSGSILSLLYPDAKVYVQGFEQTRIPNGSVDLSITNVPFVTGLRVTDTTGDKDLSKKFHDIHDFCIAKNVRKLREGGLGIFITSSGTMDNSKSLRDWIVGEGDADVIGVFRMNNTTFGGTGATSDIIVVRKRVNGRKSRVAINVSEISGERSTDYDTGETKKIKGVETPIIKHLSLDYNKYLVDHPEMMGGVMRFGFEEGDTFRPTSKALYPDKNVDQDKRLSDFTKHFDGMNEDEELSEEPEQKISQVYDYLGDDVKEGSIVVDKNGRLCIAQYGKAVPLQINDNKIKGHSKKECFKSYYAIKKALSDVLEYQVGNNDDDELKPLLDKLNKAYDNFVNTYGHLTKNRSITFLKNDVDYPNILALETYREIENVDGSRKEVFGKTDVFSRRVVEKEKQPEPKNVKDGIISSIYEFGRVDVSYIASHLNKSENEVKEEIINSGLGFENPNSKQIEVSYEYLSGNVREKLRQARENNTNGEYNANIAALEKIIPMDIPAHLIDFSFGSSWIDPNLYSEYVKERTGIDVKFTSAGGTWFMRAPEYGIYIDKNRASGVYSEKFQETIFGHILMEAAIQNKTITVSKKQKDIYGKEETIIDKDATQACSSKIDDIRNDFREWARQKMQNDEEMSSKIEREYNDQFNNSVPKTIPDEFVPEHFGGAARIVDGKEFKLRPHQGKAAVRGTTQPLLLAHEVGTGKSYTLISIAMEMRRLGTAHKPMIVVQNATVGQFVSSANKLYPNAKILTLEDADRSVEERKNFYAKIKYNDWDMIVIPQSVFERIPDSEERQMTFINSKIEEKMAVLESLKEEDPDGKSMISRRAEKEIDLLKEQMADLSSVLSDKKKTKDEKKTAIAKQNAEVKAREMLDRTTDDVENFDDMGIDALLVDEAHEYKHLGFATAMQRGVKGIDPSYSKKSQGVYLKTQAVLEKNNGRNVIFATGTPISNTAAEIWTFMRYLISASDMKDYGIYYFDDFVRNFGSIQQLLEFTTSGKYKENNRFAGYSNIPELVRIWSSIADTVLTREAGGVKDKIPEMENGKAQDIYLPQTKALRSVMKFVKSELKRYEEMSGKEKKENSYIPLTMYGIAKAAAVDARLVVSDAEDDPHSKTNEAVRQTLRSLKETDGYRGTIAIFADNYQNKQSGFNLYEDIRQKLIAQGVPAEKIVIMKSGMSVKKKLEIFDKVNSGEVRVVMGSTFTLGTGVNIQERLHTLIHLDAPNRPMDYTQRNGRILRQGNLHKEWDKPVRVLRFGVEDSLDVTAYQRLKTKGAIADSIMNGKQMMANSMENRSIEEDEDVFGDTVAQLSGSEYAMLKNQAEKDLRKYESKKKQWEADQTYIHNHKSRLEFDIKDAESVIADNEKNLSVIKKSLDGQNPDISVGGKTYGNTDEMSEFIKDYNKKSRAAEEELRKTPSSYNEERKLTIKIGGLDFVFNSTLKKEVESNGTTIFTAIKRILTYTCDELGLTDVPVKQALLKNGIEDILTNVITGNDFRERLESAKRKIERSNSELSQMAERDGKPFQYIEELKKSKERVDEYSELMKQEMEEKEKKYAELDSTVSQSNDVTYTEEDDGEEEDTNKNNTLLRDDEEDTRLSDDLPSEISDAANKLAAELGVKVNIIEHVSDIHDDSPSNQERKRHAKGWYSLSTGEVYIVLPNTHSINDAKKTVFHEIVAHKGLRDLFGNDFDKFIQDVYDNANDDFKNRVDLKMKKYGYDRMVATDEVIADMSEDGSFLRPDNKSLWDKVKQLFTDMIHRLKYAAGITLNDNDIRYQLWRSYQLIKKSNDILQEAENIDMQNRLGVGEYAKNDDTDNFTRYRNVEDTENKTFRDAYDRIMESRLNKFRESYQDSMLGLKKLQEVIAKETGEEIADNENAYMAENQMSSKSHFEMEFYKRNYFDVMMSEVHHLIRKGLSYDDIVKYVMAKHGLERNEYFAKKAADDASAMYDAAIEELQHKADIGEIPLSDAYRKITELRKKAEEKSAKAAEEAAYEDKSGLTGLFEIEDGGDFTTPAQEFVERIENEYYTQTLWDAISDATHNTLEISYKSGLISKENYDKINSMFENYVPLRGWNEDVADDYYDYLLSGKRILNPVLKKMEGRTSVADDPFATIGNMAESAILQANRNLMKQKFLNMAINHDTALLTVKDMWYVNKGTEENPQWERSLPDIPIDATADETAEIINRHEEEMKELKQIGRATKIKDKIHLKYHVTASQINEHTVIVKRNGKEYVVYVNGNPRAAQAINGLTNPDASDDSFFMKAVKRMNRQMSANFTSRNPAFVVSNLSRDLIFAGTAVSIKESFSYTKMYTRNVMRLAPQFGMWNLIIKAQKGILDGSNDIERYFGEFLANGGETGYTNLHSTEEYKKMIARDILNAQGKTDIGRIFGLKPGKMTATTTLGIVPAFQFIGKWTEFFNRSAEDTTRFATFVTSRMMGRSIQRSVSDAKEITVNFNKKGGKGNGSAFFRSIYLFFNPSVQGLQNLAHIAKNNPLLTTGAITSFMAAGFILPLINQIIINAIGGGDDDKDMYNELPEWQRRNNFVFYIGGNHFVMLPLPIEFRAFYGIGEMTYQMMQGNIDSSSMAKETCAQISDLLPINLAGSNGDIGANLMPDAFKPIYQTATNMDYFGKPIYKKYDYNKLMPEYTKAFAGANSALVNSAKFLNSITGGDDYMPGSVNINPAIVEHFFEGYFGGIGVTINQVGKSIQAIWNPDYRQTRNIPVVNRLLSSSQKTSNFSTVNEKYYQYMNEYKLTKQRERGYNEESDMGSLKYAEKIDFLENSKEYMRAEIIDDYSKDIKTLQDEINDAESEGDSQSDIKSLRFLLNETKSELVNELDRIR